MLKKLIYILIILGIIALFFTMYYVLKSADKNAFYLFSYGIVSLIMIGVTMITFMKDRDKIRYVGQYFLILIVEIMVTFYLSTIPEFQTKLLFYTVLMMIANIILFISEFGNIFGLESGEQGFHIHIHSKDSIIPPKLIIPVWIITFFVMGGAVLGMGSAFIGYPDFAVGSTTGSIASSFPIGDAENIVIMVMPFTIMMMIFGRKNFPKIASALISTMVGVISFLLYHNIVYAFNIPALTSVLFFALITIIIYQATKSLVIPSAMHIGNNFFASLYSKSVFTFQAFGGSESDVFNSSVGMIPTMLFGLLILWCFAYREDIYSIVNKKILVSGAMD